jgi:hypothetical protein
MVFFESHNRSDSFTHSIISTMGTGFVSCKVGIDLPPIAVLSPVVNCV